MHEVLFLSNSRSRDDARGVDGFLFVRLLFQYWIWTHGPHESQERALQLMLYRRPIGLH